MDPNTILNDLLSCASAISRDDDGDGTPLGEVELAETAQHMSARLEELDEWLRKGGALPRRWTEGDCCCNAARHEGACCTGWLHMDNDRGCEIERCDSCGRFETDEDAWKAHDLDCGCRWTCLKTTDCEGCGQDLQEGANEDCSHAGGCGTLNGSAQCPCCKDARDGRIAVMCYERDADAIRCSVCNWQEGSAP